jgi:hypothetical protein
MLNSALVASAKWQERHDRGLTVTHLVYDSRRR